MTNFINDGTTLPLRTPSDANPSNLTRAETNQVVNALYDVRSTLAGGGRIFNPSAFGAQGDGINDDTAAIQAAINAAKAAGGGVIEFAPGRTYKTTAELLIDTSAGLYLRGNNAYIQCYGVVGVTRSVMAIISTQVFVDGLHFYAQRTCLYGLYLQGISASNFTNIEVYQAIIDGFKSYTDNDRVSYQNCSARLCGTIYHTSGYAGNAPANIRSTVSGTVSVTSGTSAVITGSGTSFLSLGARRGDFISLHSTSPGGPLAQWLQIDTVDSNTQITCALHPPATLMTGVKYSVHVGDGYHEGPGRAENNINRLDSFLAENIAGSGFKIGGLYGARCTNLQVNAAGAYGITIACVAAGATIGTSIVGAYVEFSNTLYAIFCGYAADILVDNLNSDVGSVTTSNSSFAWGVLRGNQNAGDAGRIDPIGSPPIDYVPAGIISSIAYMQGTLKGLNYAQNAGGSGSLTIKDSNGNAVSLVSGAEVGGGYNGSGVTHLFDTAGAITNVPTIGAWAGSTAYIVGDRRSNDSGKIYQVATAGTSAGAGGPTGTGSGIADGSVVWNYIGPSGSSFDLLTKYGLKYANNAVFKVGFGVQGDIRFPTSDKSGTASPVTSDTPSGTACIKAGASSVVVNNALVTTTTKVFLSPRRRDTTALLPIVSSKALGTFTISATANATADTDIDWFIINVGS